MTPRASAVIVTYNSLHVIDSCLAQLADVSDTDLEIIVVDNSSSDGTAEHVERRWPGVRVIRNDSNAGFAAAVNIGAGHATGLAVLLLNPDCLLAPDALAVLTDACLSGRRVVAPVIEHPTGRLAVMDCGRGPRLVPLLSHYSGISRLVPWSSPLAGLYLLPRQFHGTTSVEWVSGACLMADRVTWDLLGGMTERWFMYAEDVELCLRAGRAGADVQVVAGASAIHSIGGSSTGAAASPSSAWLVNLFDLYKIAYRPSWPARLAWRTVAAAGMLSRAAVYRLRARRSGEQQWLAEAAAFVQHAKAISAVPLSIVPTSGEVRP